MTRRPTCNTGPTALALLAALLLAGVPAGAAKEADPGPMAPLHKNLNRIRFQIQNASMKLKNDIHGMSPTSTPKERPTPARQCCGTNLDRMVESVVALNDFFGELGACYDSAADPDSRTQVEFVKSDLRAVGEAVRSFAAVRVADRLKPALSEVTRTYFLLVDSAGKLPECAVQGKSRPGPAERKPAKK